MWLLHIALEAGADEAALEGRFKFSALPQLLAPRHLALRVAAAAVAVAILVAAVVIALASQPLETAEEIAPVGA